MAIVPFTAAAVMPHGTDAIDIHRQPFAKVNGTLRLRAAVLRWVAWGPDHARKRVDAMRAGMNGLWIRLALVAALLAACASVPARAVDALEAAPDIYRKLIENNHMRALEADLKPGAKVPLHSHPEHLLYLLTPGTLVIKVQGKTPYEMTFKAGDVFMLPAQTRATENNTDKTIRMLVVELKSAAASPTPRRSRKSKKR
jgi:quercetin dioxygenase-like cupin family protein